MPALLKTFADKTHKTIGAVEGMWQKSKDIVKKEYGIEEKNPKFYKLTTGILKNMLDINEAKKKDDDKEEKASLVFIKLANDIIQNGKSETLIYQFTEPKDMNAFKANLLMNKITCQVAPTEIKGQDTLYGQAYVLRLKVFSPIQKQAVDFIAKACHAIEYVATPAGQKQNSNIVISDSK